jgi:tungstate transport system substrate-binding protein
LATTTSVRDAGLLDMLLPPFERMTGYRVKVVAVGSGQAMELGRRGEADILIVHDPAGEREFVEQGFAPRRVAVMRNEFVLVGPRWDPARIRAMPALAAMGGIAATGALFVSRADRSGTHARETRLWESAGVTPERAWYRESGQGMSATLQIANELGAYTLTDIGTLLSHKHSLELDVLVDGDAELANPYHILVPNPSRFAWLNQRGAAALQDYFLDAAAQQAIADYRRVELGRWLFVPARQPKSSR